MPIHSPYASVAATRQVMQEHGLDTKKSLGQHFLISDGIIDRICELAEVSSDDIIFEIGPGIGTLTYALLSRACGVVSVERDSDLMDVLAQTCADHASTFALVNADAQDVSAHGLAEAVKARPAIAECTDRTQPNKLVANLPYAVAATLVLDCFQKLPALDSATVMVQSEVADRMCAQPSTKDYGAYTVKLSLYAQPAGRFTVKPSNFFPPPRVDSAVLRLNRHAPTTADGDPVPPAVISATCIMAEAAFATRRKTILNSAKTYFETRGEAGQPIIARLPSILEAANIDPRSRGESLTTDDFIRLGQAFVG